MTDEPQVGILGALWQYKWMSATIVLVTVLLSLGAALLVAPRSQATATIALSTPPQDSVLAAGVTGDASLGRYTAQRAGFVTSDAVLTAVAKELGSSDITALRNDLSASPSSTSNTIVITAEADSGAAAVKLAKAAADAYRSETAKDVQAKTDAAVRSIDASAQSIRDGASGSVVAQTSAASTLSQLAIHASDIRTSSALFGDGVDFVIAPRADAVSKPSIPIREAAVGFVLGLVLAATAAWIRANPKRADR
ncbi:MAG: hypothetical protein ACXVJW_16835 [Acidimicrobiia bacterium]